MIYDYKRLVIDLLATLVGYDAQLTSPALPSLIVFNGLTAPTPFDGIWFKTEDAIVNTYVNPTISLEENVWASEPNMPESIDDAFNKVTYINGTIYIANDYVSGVYYLGKLNLETGVWNFVEVLPHSLDSLTSIEEKLYGFDTYTVYVRDDITEVWTSYVLTTAGDQFYESACIALATDIFILGGFPNPTMTLKLDTLTLTATFSGSLPTSMEGSTAVHDGYNIYVLGGVNPDGNLIQYNPLTSIFTVLPSMAFPTWRVGAAFINHYIYVFGAYGDPTYKNTVQRYDLYTNQWEIIDNMIKGTYKIGCIAIGDRIYCFGGNEAGENETLSVRYLSFNAPSYPENSAVILSGGAQSANAKNIAKIYSNINVAVNNAWIFKGGKLESKTIYIGNGADWVPFKL